MNTARAGIAAMLVASLALGGCGVFRGNKPKSQTLGERVSVLNFEQQVAAEAEVADLPVLLPAAEVNADWTQPGGSASKAMGHMALGSGAAVAWRASLGRGSDATRRLNAAPVVAANRLFAMDVEANVFAFDATTGAPLWRASITRENEDRRAAFGGGVSTDGERVYATSGYGVVAAFEAATGRQVWRRQLATPLRAAPAVAEGRIYVMTADSQLQALDAATGEQAWEVNATQEPAGILSGGSPAVVQGTVVAGFGSGELFALRIENGRTVWQDALARTGRTTALAALSDIAASPVVDRGRVFAIGHGGRMAALELATGQRVWERAFAGTETPTVAGDFVFALSVDGELVALTRGEGKIRWVRDLGRWRNAEKKKGAVEWAGPVLAGGKLILVSSTERMVRVDPATGEIEGETRLGAPAYLPPIVANNMLYVLTDDGRVTAYR